MSQKNFQTARSAQALYSSVVAKQGRQLDRPDRGAQSPVGLSVDAAVRSGRGVVASRSVASSPCAGPAGQSILRAAGDAGPSPAQGPKQSVGFLWRGSDSSRAHRFGHSPLAQSPDDSSNPGSTPTGDAKASGSVSERPSIAPANGSTAERCPSSRLHLLRVNQFETLRCRLIVAIRAAWPGGSASASPAPAA